MRRLLLTTLSAGLGLALAGTLTVSPAHAETQRYADARGDVRVVTLTEESDFEEVPPSQPSTTPIGDVVRASILHSKRRVAVTLTYAELRRNRAELYQLLFRGDNGQRRAVLIDTLSRKRGESTMVRVSTGREVCERGLRHRINYRAKTVRVTFPRPCIGASRFVSVAGASLWLRANDESAEIFYDDPFREGGEIDEVSLTFSKGVRRR